MLGPLTSPVLTSDNTIESKLNHYASFLIDIKDIENLAYDPGFFTIKGKGLIIIENCKKNLYFGHVSLFSISGLNQTDQRNRLNPKTPDKFTF